jgi:hypothetical protein
MSEGCFRHVYCELFDIKPSDIQIYQLGRSHRRLDCSVLGLPSRLLNAQAHGTAKRPPPCSTKISLAAASLVPPVTFDGSMVLLGAG